MSKNYRLPIGLRQVGIGLALLLVALIIITAATPQGRVVVRTVAFLPQVLPAVPVRPMEWFTGDPTRQEVSYPLESGRGIADLYVPAGGGQHSAILLFLGVNPAGRNDSRVVGLAEALARTGVVVMIPWSETMTEKRIAVEEIDNLVRGFQYLRSLDMVDPDSVGMGGFCVGASLSIVAAQDPRIRDHVRFVNSFGGYFDAEDLIRSVVMRSRFYEGEVESWHPNALTVEVVTTHLIEGIPDSRERRALTRIFIEDSGEFSSIELDTLSPEARAVYKLLSGPDSVTEFDAAMSQLSTETLHSIRRISPSTHIDRLDARLLIMHDREDSLVPSEESRRLARAIDGQEAYYTEFSFFQHVDPTRPVSPPVFIKEGFKLFLHMYNVLRQIS